jgi:hypothetical protein
VDIKIYVVQVIGEYYPTYTKRIVVSFYVLQVSLELA